MARSAMIGLDAHIVKNERKLMAIINDSYDMDDVIDVLQEQNGASRNIYRKVAWMFIL